MEARFLRGEDEEFDYKGVDEGEEFDAEAEREEKWFEDEEARWVADGEENSNRKGKLEGETGIQDF